MQLPYTIVRHGALYYNRRPHSGFLRLSLRTSCERAALRYVVLLNELVDRMTVRRAKLEEIRQAARVWLQRNIEQNTVAQVLKAPAESTHDLGIVELEHKDKLSSIKEAQDIVNEHQHEMMFSNDCEYLNQEFTLQVTPEENKVLAYYDAQANVAFHKHRLEPTTDFAAIPPISERAASELISSLIEKYLKEKKREVAAQNYGEQLQLREQLPW